MPVVGVVGAHFVVHFGSETGILLGDVGAMTAVCSASLTVVEVVVVAAGSEAVPEALAMN